MAPPRKCSRDDCPPRNVDKDLTVYCFCCKNPIHLLCYGIVLKPEDIFVIGNVVMLCDECLEAPKEFLSPKRKQSNSANLVQRTINVNSPVMSLSKTAQNESTPSIIVPITAKTTNKQMHTVIEKLAQKIETQTATIAGLKHSVDSMNDIVTQQNTTETLRRTSDSTRSARKTSYAHVVKSQRTVNETPTSSKSLHVRTPKSNTAVLSGTSNHVIGKPLSPNQDRPRTVQIDRQNAAPRREKAVWVSGIHRDTTEAEMVSYIKDTLGVTSVDEFDVRKLVKKDKELSTYSFVSFKISSSVTIFNALLDPTKWPRTVRLREFDLERKSPSGVKLNQQSSPGTATSGTDNRIPINRLNNDLPKNEQQQPTASMETEPVS